MSTKLSELNEYSQGFANGRAPKPYAGQVPVTAATQPLTRSTGATNGVALSEAPATTSSGLGGLGELVQVVT